MEVQTRLSEYLDFKKLNFKDFERKCGLGNGTAAALSVNTRRTTLDRISDRCKDLNIEWLITGEGDMLLSNKIESAVDEQHTVTIKDKLKEFMDYKGVSMTATEKNLGWGVGAFVKAKSITSDRAKEFLLYFPELSAEWLMRDEGPMLRAKEPVIDIDRITALVDTIATLQTVIADKNATIDLLNDEIRKLKSHK